jgi:trk system potassium uptake protein TrkA
MIAVTDNDAVNMLSSVIADRVGIPTKIARVRSLEFGLQDSIITAPDMKIDMVIHPEELTAQEILRLIKLRTGNMLVDIADGAMQVMATRIQEDSPLAGKKLKHIALMFKEFPFRIVSVARGITTIIPDGDFELAINDQVFILVGTDHLPELMELVQVEQEQHHRVMILGGGLIGTRVAELLGDEFEVKLIEKDERRAEALSARLVDTEVLHGDGSDANTLTQAGLLDMDTILTATWDNETNIMSCLLAKHLLQEKGSSAGRQNKTIALVNKEEYLVLAATMGADIALNKKVLAANEILKFIRRGSLLSVAHLHGLDAEVVEIVAEKGAPITKKPLYQLDIVKEMIIIGGVNQNDTWETAVGSTHVRPGDRAIAICTSSGLKELQRLFLG